MSPATHRKFSSLIILITAFISVVTAASGQEPPKKTTQTQKIVEQGIAIEFTADPLVQKATSIRAAEDVNVTFKVTDTTTGTPVKGLGLAAWISMREGSKAHIATMDKAAPQIMDVNQAEVRSTFERQRVDYIVHGHTHRPRQGVRIHSRRKRTGVLLPPQHRPGKQLRRGAPGRRGEL